MVGPSGPAGGGQDANISALVGEEIIPELEDQGEGLTQPASDIVVDVEGELGKILGVLTAVNDIRAQVIRLGLNPSLRIAIDTEVIPVLSILTSLATSSNFFSSAALNLSNINFAKTHEIKKLLNIVYEITDVSEDVLEVATKLILATLPKCPY